MLDNPIDISDWYAFVCPWDFRIVMGKAEVPSVTPTGTTYKGKLLAPSS
jgi:hypothetical protein